MRKSYWNLWPEARVCNKTTFFFSLTAHENIIVHMYKQYWPANGLASFRQNFQGDLLISVGFRAHVFSGVVIPNTSKFTYGSIFNLVWISASVSFPQVSWESALEFIYPMKRIMSSQAGVNIMGTIEGFMYAHGCIMGNQGKMAGNSKICIRIQSQLILPEFTS